MGKPIFSGALVEETQPQPAGLSFNQQYHQDTVDQGKEMINDDGSVTTANVIGVHHQGKEYNIPSYNRDERRNMSQKEAKEYWLPKIESGAIPGFNTISAAEASARSEHQMMDDFARKQQPMQTPTGKPIFSGELVDEPADGVSGWAQGKVKALSDWVTGERVEDFPEVPTLSGMGATPEQPLGVLQAERATGSFQLADTPIGQLNILKKSAWGENKDLQLDVDKFDNPVIKVDGKPHYFNKPAPSLNDFDYLIKGVQELMPVLVGGSVAAPLKVVGGSLLTGATGAMGEAIAQTKAEAAGAEEGYDLEKIGLTGAYTAGGEAAGRLIVKTVGGVFGKLFGKKTDISKYFDGERFTDEGLEILKRNDVSPEMLSKMMRDEMQKTGVINTEQAKRYNEFIDQGMKPTKAQITQSADDFRFQQQQMKTKEGAELRSDIDAQNAQILSKTDELAEATGTTAMTPEETGTRLVDHITKKALSADARIGAIYKEIQATAPTAKNVDLSKTLTEMKKVMGFNTMSKGAIKAVLSDLKMRGIVNQNGKLQGKISTQTAEEVRKVMNMVYGEGNPTAKRLMTQLKDALDDDVFRVAGKDIYKKGREAKVAFHKEYTDAKAHKLQAKSKNVLEKLYDGSITPDKAYNVIVKNGSRKDLQRVKAAMHTGSEAEKVFGKQIWDDMRGQVIRDAIDMATRGGRNELGDVVFSMKPFKKVIENYARSGKLRTLFSDPEITELRSLINVGELRIPVTGTALGEGPSSAAIQQMTKMVGKTKVGQMALGVNQGLRSFADDATIRAELEMARHPAGPTIEAVTKGTKLEKEAASLPARLGAPGGLFMMGRDQENQRRRQQR